MSKKNKIIVIIVSYNGKKYWDELMPTLLEEKYQDIDIDILVVDNNSSDGSADYLARNYPAIKVIRAESNLGFVGANNIAYQYAKENEAKYIYLLNQDTEVTNGFLRPLYDFAENNKFGSLQSKLRLWPDKKLINTTGNAIHFLGFGYGLGSQQVDKNNQKIVKINYASGAGVFIGMKALEDLGYLFDETMFMYLEDLDLGWSLSMLGYDSYLIPNSIVYHKYEFKRSMNLYTYFERNRLWVMLKNYKLGTLILIFPAWFIMELGQLGFALVNKRFLEKIKAYSFLFSAKQLSLLMGKRKNIQSKRLRSDRQVVGHFKGLILFQPLDIFLLKIANIFFFIYWRVIKLFIFW
ncbi:MAG: glycosyltransferase family 2 protein [Patescibacteria group bacterium]|jgi:GT2 family glycosyltransferase